MQTPNKEVVRRVFEDAINHRRMDLLADLIADDYTGPQGGGRDSFIASIEALRSGFPDIAYELQDLVADDDRVAVRWQWRGTHDGTYRGPGGTYPATATKVSNDGIAIFRVEGGKLRRAWLLTDRLGFLQAIGALPKP